MSDRESFSWIAALNESQKGVQDIAGRRTAVKWSWAILSLPVGSVRGAEFVVGAEVDAAELEDKTRCRRAENAVYLNQDFVDCTLEPVWLHFSWSILSS